MRLLLLESARKEFKDKFGADLLDTFDRLVRDDTTGEYDSAERDYAHWVGKSKTEDDLKKLFNRSVQYREKFFEEKFGENLKHQFELFIKNNPDVNPVMRQESTWLSNNYLPADLRIFLKDLKEKKFADKFGENLLSRFMDARKNKQQMSDNFIADKKLSKYNTYDYWLEGDFTKDDLEKFLDQLQDKKLFYPDQAVEDGSKLVYESDNYKIYEITNFAGSHRHSTATGWCTGDRYSGSSNDPDEMLKVVHNWNPTMDNHWKSYMSSNRRMWVVYHLNAPKVTLKYNGSFAGQNDPFEETDYLKYNILTTNYKNYSDITVTHPIKDQEENTVEYFKENPEVFNFFCTLKNKDGSWVINPKKQDYSWSDNTFYDMVHEIRPVDPETDSIDGRVDTISLPSAKMVRRMPQSIIADKSFWLSDKGLKGKLACVVDGVINPYGTQTTTLLPTYLIVEFTNFGSALEEGKEYKINKGSYIFDGIYFKLGDDQDFLFYLYNNGQANYDVLKEVVRLKGALGIRESLNENLSDTLPIEVRRGLRGGNYMDRLKYLLKDKYKLNLAEINYVPEDYKKVSPKSMKDDFNDSRRLYILTTKKFVNDRLAGYQCFIPGITTNDDKCYFRSDFYAPSLQPSDRKLWKYQNIKTIIANLVSYGYIDLDANKYDDTKYADRLSRNRYDGSDAMDKGQKLIVEPDYNGIYQARYEIPAGRDKSGYKIGTQGELKQRLLSDESLIQRINNLNPSMKKWIEENLYKQIKLTQKEMISVITNPELISGDPSKDRSDMVVDIQQKYNEILLAYKEALNYIAELSNDLSELKYQNLTVENQDALQEFKARINDLGELVMEKIKEVK